MMDFFWGGVKQKVTAPQIDWQTDMTKPRCPQIPNRGLSNISNTNYMSSELLNPCLASLCEIQHFVSSMSTNIRQNWQNICTKGRWNTMPPVVTMSVKAIYATSRGQGHEVIDSWLSSIWKSMLCRNPSC